jgi:hypothetical protein
VSFEYRLVVISPPFGASKGTVNMTDPLFSVDSYDVTPDGNCLEATFRLPPKSLSFTIALRDVITIETRPNSAAAWVPRYRGFVALAGNPQSDNVEVYRLVGLKQRLYERIMGDAVTNGFAGAIIESADVATMASNVFGFAGANGAVVGIDFFTIDAPTLTFTLGKRYTQLESAGAALDAFAQTVGSFVVPTGETYTYDGVTYNATDEVPAVTWGVKPDGALFFRRPALNAAAFNEDDLDVDVEWPALSGEDVVTRPTLVYYPGMDLSRVNRLILRDFTANVDTDLDPVFQLWFYRKPVNDAVDNLVQLPNPETLLLNATSLYIQNVDTFTNSANITDGNPATAGTGGVGATFSLARGGTPLSEAQYGIRINAEFGDTNAIVVSGSYGFSVSGVNYDYQWRWVPEATDEPGQQTILDVTFPILVQADVFKLMQDGGVLGTVNVGIDVIAGPNGSSGTINLYDFRIFQSTLPGNASFANRLSDAYSRLPVQTVTNVKVYDEEPLRTRVDVTPLVGSVLEVPVERVQYSITTAEGITTTYHAGQPFDGELVSERVVLEGLARRAVGRNG